MTVGQLFELYSAAKAGERIICKAHTNYSGYLSSKS